MSGHPTLTASTCGLTDAASSTALFGSVTSSAKMRRWSIHMDMTVWDIMGEKGFRDLLKEAFFHGAKGVVAVCDLTRYSTLKELDDWVQSVFNVVGEIPVVYAVNKIDLKDEVMILYGDKEIAQAVRAFEAPYFYASAKTGENVEVLFRRLGAMVLQREGIAVAT